MHNTPYGEQPSPHILNDGNSNVHFDPNVLVEIEPAAPDQVFVELPPSPPVGTDDNPAVGSDRVPVDDVAPGKRLGRGTNPKGDNIWTRHQAICGLAAAGDLILGGFDSAHLVEQPLQFLKPLKSISATLLQVCPWLLNTAYLNFGGSAVLAKRGLEECYHAWAVNRIWYFYHGERTEHPAQRVKGNLRAVYREFYDLFWESIADRQLISEETAKSFWISVADRVPFIAPITNENALLVAEPDPSVGLGAEQIA